MTQNKFFKIHVTEHQIIHKNCSFYERINKGKFSKELTQEAQYSVSLKLLCVHLQNYQILFLRAVENLVQI